MFLGYIDPGAGFTIFSLGAWVAAFFLGFLGVSYLLFKKILRFFKKTKKFFIFFFLILSGLLIIGIAMDRGREIVFNKKIIILGLDGLSPEIVESMIEGNSLPNFTRLKEQGSYRRLTTTNPAQSPVAWAGFATGKNPGENGVFDFIVRDPATYSLDLCFSNFQKGKPKKLIKSKCFWDYTSEAKIPTIIISCPGTFPPDKIYGKMLSGMGVPDILGTEGTFTFYTSKHLPEDKDIGGKVFKVQKSSVMIMDLIGPKVASFGREARNAKVPFKVSLCENKDMIVIEYQGNKDELKAGQWSEWREVSFRLGLFKKVKGIFKFYLTGIEPEFNLYISPINFDPRKPLFQISYPKDYSRELVNKIGLYYTQGMPMDTWAVSEERLTEKAFLEQANEVLREKKTILDFELNRLKKGVLFCYFEDSDIIQHMFWRYTDTGHPLFETRASEEYKGKIKEWYKKMDEILGNVMQKMGREDVLIVLSDHGFNTFRRVVHVNSWLREKGYLELKDYYAESGKELLEDIDWSKTKAYAISFGAIYINQKGREKYGIVNPGSETEGLKKEIAIKMKEWKDEKYDKPIVNNVYLGEEIFRGDCAKQAPDLYIGFNIGYRASWQTALGAAPKDMVEDNLKKWSGDHLFDPCLIPGVIFSNKKITKEKPSIYDITPTILSILGFDRKRVEREHFYGESLFH